MKKEPFSTIAFAILIVALIAGVVFGLGTLIAHTEQADCDNLAASSGLPTKLLKDGCYLEACPEVWIEHYDVAKSLKQIQALCP